jgi:hypothetical protein
MKKLLIAACLLIMSHGFGLAQSTITIGDTNTEAASTRSSPPSISNLCGSSK